MEKKRWCSGDPGSGENNENIFLQKWTMRKIYREGKLGSTQAICHHILWTLWKQTPSMSPQAHLDSVKNEVKLEDSG